MRTPVPHMFSGYSMPLFCCRAGFFCVTYTTILLAFTHMHVHAMEWQGSTGLQLRRADQAVEGCEGLQ